LEAAALAAGAATIAFLDTRALFQQVTAQSIRETGHVVVRVYCDDLKGTQEIMDEQLRSDAAVLFAAAVSSPTTRLEARPDPLVFLPNLRLAYGVKKREKGTAELLARANANGLIFREAGVQRVFGMDSPLRETMLACFASSCGFGPRVFAAWVVPPGAFAPDMKLNVGDPCAHFASGVEAPKRKETGFTTKELPRAPWWNRAWELRASEGEPVDPKDGYGLKAEVELQFATYAEALEKKLSNKSFCVLMEGFEGSMKKLKPNGPVQVRMAVEKIYEQCERMGAAGVLHGDIKDLNACFRTWNSMGGPESDWDNIEVRMIDFDAQYVKLVPFVPAEVLTLVNFAGYMAFLRCYNDGRQPTSVWVGAAEQKLRPLLVKINDKYGDPVAPFARAFLQLSSENLVDSSNGFWGAVVNVVDEMQNPMRSTEVRKNPNRSTQPFRAYGLKNDEFEAARAFLYFVKNYFTRPDCTFGFNRHAESLPPRTPTIAKILSYVLSGDMSRAVEIAPTPDAELAIRTPPPAPAAPAAPPGSPSIIEFS
jgi:hypothetical protein